MICLVGFRLKNHQLFLLPKASVMIDATSLKAGSEAFLQEALSGDPKAPLFNWSDSKEGTGERAGEIPS